MSDFLAILLGSLATAIAVVITVYAQIRLFKPENMVHYEVKGSGNGAVENKPTQGQPQR